MQTRRQFIGKTAATAATLGLGLSLSSRAFAQAKGANEKIVFGLIGCGGMGRANLDRFMGLKGVEVGALCDVDQTHLEATVKQVTATGRPAPQQYMDFRKLLEQRDVDAVIIGTPDHWHAIPFIQACEAGKDIYCEKPISHSFVEAKAMQAAALHFKRVVQVGTWQRSMNHFQEAINFVRSGKMGKISTCRAWAFNQNKSIGHKSGETAPPTLNYDLWLGPAPAHKYQSNRCHGEWRWFYEYGGGLMTDWGVHMIDIVLLAMQSEPLQVAASGGIFAMDDDRDTPDTLQVVYQFPKFTMNWEHRFNNTRGIDGGRNHGSEFIGTNGTLIVDRTDYQYFPNPEQKDVELPPKCQNTDSTHWQNFLDCVKSREKPRSDIQSMAKTTMLCHLGNISYQCGKTMRWDAARQEIINQNDAKYCLSYQRDYRKPWGYKNYKA